MKVLQIWLGTDLPNSIRRNMETVHAFTPDADHYFIGRKSTAPIGYKVIDPDQEIEKTYKFLKNEFWWKRYCQNNCYLSDMLRLSWAIQHRDLLYVDADVSFNNSPIIPNLEKPCLGIANNKMDFFILWSGNPSWWKSLIEKAQKYFPMKNTTCFVLSFNFISREIGFPEKFDSSFFTRH